MHFFPNVSIMDGTTYNKTVDGLEANALVEVTLNDDDDTLTIFATKEGIGYEHKSRAGYSEYTWWWDHERNFYPGKDWEWFYSMGLNQMMRESLSQRNVNTIKEKLEALNVG